MDDIYGVLICAEALHVKQHILLLITITQMYTCVQPCTYGCVSISCVHPNGVKRCVI